MKVRKDQPDVHHHTLQASEWKALTGPQSSSWMREAWDPEEARAPWQVRGTNHHSQNACLLSSRGYFIKDPHTASETKELHSYSTCKMINTLIPLTSIKIMIRKKMAGRRVWGRKRAGKKGFRVQRILYCQLYETSGKTCCPQTCLVVNKGFDN